MKNSIITLIIPLTILFAFGCKNDDENPAPVNQPPGGVVITTQVEDNNVTLSWTPAEDPDGDAIQYSIVVEGDTVAEEITANTYLLSDLRYEKEYSGKIIARDVKGDFGETSFSFITGFLFLKSYEEGGIEYFLEYNDEGQLINIEDPHNHYHPLLWNGDGHLITLGDVSFSYNTSGLINSIDDGNGEGIIQYDGKNRIARTFATYEFGPSYSVSVVRDHTYNEQDQLIQIDEESYTVGTSDNYYSRFKLQYDSKGNVIQVKEEYSSDNITFNPSNTHTYTYDDKKNPWYTVLVEKANFSAVHILNYEILKSTMSIGNSVIYRTFWMSKNNLLSYRTNYSSGYHLREYSYTYNDDNYPITLERIYTSPDNPSSTSYERWYY